MFNITSARPRWIVVLLLAITTALALLPSLSTAQQTLFFEETASAFWAVPYECANGSTVQGTLLVLSTRDFEAPDTEDSNPMARVQFQAICPDGTSFSWSGIIPATITSTENLKSVTATGTGTVRDNFGETHEVSFNVTWTGVGPEETTVNGPGSMRRQREATAIGEVIFDGEVIVNGEASHPNRPAPFIRVDTER
jgi:hypothetical protein